MRKLFLASTSFKTGDNVYTQINLVAIDTYATAGNELERQSVDRIAKENFLKETEGTDAEWLSTWSTDTYTGSVDEPKAQITENKIRVFEEWFPADKFPNIDKFADNADDLSVHVIIDINGKQEYFDTGWYNFDEKEWVNCNKDFTTEIAKGKFHWRYI